MDKTRERLLQQNRELAKQRFARLVDVEREKRFAEEFTQFHVKNELLLEGYDELVHEMMDLLGKWQRHSEELLSALKEALNVGNALIQQNKRLMATPRVSKIKLKV